MNRRLIDNRHQIKEYVYGGKGTFTLVSKPTGKRFTYKLKPPAQPDGPVYPIFVTVLTGSDNESQYEYLGSFLPNEGYRHGRKSRIKRDALSVQAISWFLHVLVNGSLDEVEFWHEGRCGRCGRKLTVPESIETRHRPALREQGVAMLVFKRNQRIRQPGRFGQELEGYLAIGKKLEYFIWNPLCRTGWRLGAFLPQGRKPRRLAQVSRPDYRSREKPVPLRK